jgi:hypothetical protein
MFWGSSLFTQGIDALQKSIKAYGSRATTRLTLKMPIKISNNVAKLSGRTPKVMVFKALTLSSAGSSLSLPKASSLVKSDGSSSPFLCASFPFLWAPCRPSWYSIEPSSSYLEAGSESFCTIHRYSHTAPVKEPSWYSEDPHQQTCTGTWLHFEPYGHGLFRY